MAAGPGSPLRDVVASTPERVTPWAVTKAASGWDKEALGQKRQHIHDIPSPHPGAAVGKMISWGFYLLFLLCDQCTSLCCCSRASQACVRSVIYGGFMNRTWLCSPKAGKVPSMGNLVAKLKARGV